MRELISNVVAKRLLLTLQKHELLKEEDLSVSQESFLNLPLC